MEHPGAVESLSPSGVFRRNGGRYEDDAALWLGTQNHAGSWTMSLKGIGKRRRLQRRSGPAECLPQTAFAGVDIGLRDGLPRNGLANSGLSVRQSFDSLQ